MIILRKTQSLGAIEFCKGWKISVDCNLLLVVVTKVDNCTAEMGLDSEDDYHDHGDSHDVSNAKYLNHSETLAKANT